MSAGVDYPPERSALIRIQAKLDRWELKHLREHAAQLADRLEAVERELVAATNRATDAEQYADFWREQVMNLQEELADDLALGMTRDGSLHVVDATGSPS